MKLPILLSLSLLLLATDARAQACLPGYPVGYCMIQPALNEGDDVAPYCFQPTLARGQHETLYSLTSDIPGGECHSFVDYMKFVLPSNLVGPGQTVTSASLLVPYAFSFVYEGTPTPPPHPPITMRVHRVLAPWTENAVTWNSKPGYGGIVAEITGVTAPVTLNFNVTNVVRNWVLGVDQNNGFAITSPNDRAIGTYSWEAELTPAQRPTLVSRLLIVVGSGAPAIPIMPAWITALFVVCVATVLALYMPRTRGPS